jgi:hypothetical protein
VYPESGRQGEISGHYEILIRTFEAHPPCPVADSRGALG